MNSSAQYYIGITQQAGECLVHVLDRYGKSIWSGSCPKGNRSAISLLTATLAGSCVFALEQGISPQTVISPFSCHEVAVSILPLLMDRQDAARRAEQMANCLRLSHGSRLFAGRSKRSDAPQPIKAQRPSLTQRVAKLMVRLEQLEQDLATFNDRDQLAS